MYHTQADKSTAYARSADAHTGSNFTISLTDLMEGVKPKAPTISLDENGEPVFGEIPNTPTTKDSTKYSINPHHQKGRSGKQGGLSDARGSVILL